MTMCAKGVAKLIEECGELQQVLGKRLAMWDRDDHWDGTNLRERMIAELGDVMAAARFVAEQFDIAFEVEERTTDKLATFDHWDSVIDNNEHGIDGRYQQAPTATYPQGSEGS